MIELRMLSRLRLVVVNSSEKDQSLTFLRYDTYCIENDASINFSIVEYVLIAVGTCLPSRCIAMIREIHIQTHSQKADLTSQTNFMELSPS
jgi:hypothetical protein